MNIRKSKGYAAFKAVNGGLFIVFGIAIVLQMLRVAGPNVDAIPGFVLGAALVALGANRLYLLVRTPR
jgi:hypothetical protein